MPNIFEVKDKDLAGRIGVLKTKSGSIETPAFLPVVNPVKQDQDFPARFIHDIGFRSIITNAYIIKKNFGYRIKGISDLRAVLGFNGIIATDSGAFQLMRYGDIDIDNREIVEYQTRIESDIAVILDIPTKSNVSYVEASKSVDATISRALEVKDLIADTNQIWILPVQGGPYRSLVEKSAKISRTIARDIEGFRIFGIGSPVTFLEEYRYSDVLDIIFTAKYNLPPDYPIHLFGAGHPMFFPFAIALGVDTFDSASYILYAKDYRYITDYGTERIEDLEVFPCSCPICSKYTPHELMEMNRKDAIRLIAYHNLYAISKEIRRIKTAIREGRLWEYIVERSFSHPSLRKALDRFKRYISWIEELAPFSKGRRGLLISHPINIFRPQIVRARVRALRYICSYMFKTIKCNSIYLVPGDPDDKPFSNSNIYRKIIEVSTGLIDDKCVIFYAPIIGFVPYGIDVTYPYAHYEYWSEASKQVFKDLIDGFMNIVECGLKIYKTLRIIIYTSKKFKWSVDFAYYILGKRFRYGDMISITIIDI